MSIKYRYPDDPMRVSVDYLKKLQDKEPGKWMAQFKFDGWRCPIYKDDGKFGFYAKRASTRERDKPPPQSLVDELEKLNLPDGCAFDAEWMWPRDIKGLLKGRHYFVLFDMTYHNGLWIGDKGFDKRLALMREVVKPTEQVQIAETRDNGWVEMFEDSKKDWLTEGIVLRESASPLIGNNTSSKDNACWCKVKWRDIHEATNY